MGCSPTQRITSQQCGGGLGGIRFGQRVAGALQQGRGNTAEPLLPPNSGGNQGPLKGFIGCAQRDLSKVLCQPLQPSDSSLGSQQGCHPALHRGGITVAQLCQPGPRQTHTGALKGVVPLSDPQLTGQCDGMTMQVWALLAAVSLRLHEMGFIHEEDGLVQGDPCLFFQSIPHQFPLLTALGGHGEVLLPVLEVQQGDEGSGLRWNEIIEIRFHRGAQRFDVQHDSIVRPCHTECGAGTC